MDVLLCVSCLNVYQEDVGAEFEDAVDAGQLLEHDGVTDPAEELSDKLPDHQHHRGIQSHDAAGTETQEEDAQLWCTDTNTTPVPLLALLLLLTLQILLLQLLLLLLIPKLSLRVLRLPIYCFHHY